VLILNSVPLCRSLNSSRPTNPDGTEIVVAADLTYLFKLVAYEAFTSHRRVNKRR